MRKLMLLCAALAVIASAVSANLWRKLRAERELVATLKLQVPPATQPPTATQPAPDHAPPIRPAISALPPVAGGQAAAAPARAASAMPDVGRILADSAALARDPEYRKASAARLRMNIPQDYPGLVEQLGLTPEEAGKLFDLLAASQSELMSASAIAPISARPGDFSPGNVAAIEELMRTRETLKLRGEQSLAALLGDARHEQFKEYELQKPTRNQVTVLGRMLAAAGQPLSDAQVRAVTAVFVAEEKRRQEFSQQPAQPGQPADQVRIDDANLELQTERNRRLLDALQPHLSTPQLESYRAMLEQQVAQSRAALRVRREQSAAQGAEAPAPPAGY